MNENSQKLNTGNPVIRRKAYLKNNDKSVIFPCFSEILITFLTVLGTLLSISVLEMASPRFIQGGTSGLFIAAVFLVFSYNGKTFGKIYNRTGVRLLFSAVVGLAAAVVFRVKIVSVIGGIYLYFEEDKASQIAADDSFITGLILGFLFTLLIYCFQKILRSPPIIIAVTFIVVLQAVIYEYYTNSIPNIIGIFILIMSWVLQIVYNRSDTPNMAFYALIVCGIAAVIGILCVFKIGIERPYLIENGASIIRGEKKLPSVNIPYIPMRDIWKTSPNDTPFDNDSESLLYTDGKFEFEGIDVLEVKMDFNAFSDSAVYLRHFFGANYSGNAWSELSDEQKLSESEVISGFTNENLSPWNLDSLSWTEISSSYPELITDFEFSVKNLGMITRKPFLPYFLAAPNEFYDAGEILDTEDEYIGTVNMPAGFYENDEILNDILTAGSLAHNPELNADERSYRAFVYANYLGVPPDFTAENPVLNDDYMEYITSENIQTGKSTLTDEQVFVRKINFIHGWLRDNCEYNIDVGEMPSDKDFALYFLNEKREGFCQHFATSATLLCRAAGIPARYVTGFIISPSDYEKRSDDGTVTVKDSRAHAWTEVYVNGYGWMPLDFTSGYSNVRTSLTAAQRQERLAEEELLAVETQPTITTAAPVTEQTEPLITEIPPVREQTEAERSVRFPIAILPLILVILTIFAFTLRHITRKNKTIKQLQSTDGFDTLLMRTKYILNTSGFSFDSILTDSESFLKRLSESSYKMVTPIIKKAISVRFGRENINDEELRTLNKQLDSAVALFYESQKPLKRFWLQYILNVL
ncbi:MAG: transglutaminase-like domain-containing protein [Ruminococcus sp.]|jgi:transglutaminase-like putative cysteine protease|nr:transglutaminase-like domain-containing protein [Ruminococcus sp.]